MIGRRNLLLGLSAMIAAPAVIRTPGLLMPVRTIAREVGPAYLFGGGRWIPIPVAVVEALKRADRLGSFTGWTHSPPVADAGMFSEGDIVLSSADLPCPDAFTVYRDEGRRRAFDAMSPRRIAAKIVAVQPVPMSSFPMIA